jgi:gluconokinase
MSRSIVIMGVAGCGKSSVGAAAAADLGLPLVEGDEHHSAESLAKMRQGVPLTDDDRKGWLARLAERLQASPEGVVLTCSALKRKYREQLRASSPDLCFVYLDIDREAAQARVAGRGAAHFFSADLVASQFAALEVPTGEARVLRLDASAPIATLRLEIRSWWHSEETA